MSDIKIIDNEWEQPNPSKDYGYDKDPKYDPRRWPVGSVTDHRLYGLTYTVAKRLVTTSTDTDPEVAILDADGALVFAAVDIDAKGPTARTRQEIASRRGSYADMASLAFQINARQDKWGQREFNYYPYEIGKDTAAA